MISISLSDILRATMNRVGVKNDDTAVDEDVWFRFITEEDDAVRPSHAALHGTVWRTDDPDAPVPPLDYGCRCTTEYCAPPGSRAAHFLPSADGMELTTPAEAFSTYLDKELSDWEEYAGMVKRAHREDYANKLAIIIQEAEGWTLTKARDFAQIIARVRGMA